MTTSQVAEWPQLTKLHKDRTHVASPQGHARFEQHIRTRLATQNRFVLQIVRFSKIFLQSCFIVRSEKHENGTRPEKSLV